MTSVRNTGVLAKGGHEHDAFTPSWRRLLCGFGRPGAAKAAKRSYNRRVRRAAVEVEDG